MARFRLLVEYDGGPFVGWQRQDNGPSVQAAIEAAGQKMCGEAVACVAAGRTDAGVHALGMTVHIDFSQEVSAAKNYDADDVCGALNFHLKPAPISILHAQRVDDDFHARFSATARHYLYRVINRREPVALERDRAWQVKGLLDEAAMHEGAQHLVGKHDFSTFRAGQCQAASPVKTLSYISVSRADEEISIQLAAPSFSAQSSPFNRGKLGASGVRPMGTG